MKYDAIVIGVGTFGAAACDHLARRGHTVLGLEQFTVAHNRGSHHGRSRIFRVAYYEHPDYVPLLKRAHQHWRDLERRSGIQLLHETGVLYLGKASSELMRGTFKAAAEHHVSHRELSRSQLTTEFPQFSVPNDFIGFHEPAAGFVLAEPSVKALAGQATTHGATILENQQVLGWSADTNSVTVTTASSTHHARSLIITAGAWSDRLITDLGIPLTVTRQVLGWVRPPTPDPFRASPAGSFPCWAIGNDDGSLHYGFPIRDGEDSLKLALHARGQSTNPDRVDRHVTATDESTFRSVLETYLKSAAGPTTKTCICLYTNSPDSHFIIDRHPLHPNVVFACGSSGHGFKFAPVLGEALADLATSGRSDLPIGFLSLKRFAR